MADDTDTKPLDLGSYADDDSPVDGSIIQAIRDALVRLQQRGLGGEETTTVYVGPAAYKHLLHGDYYQVRSDVGPSMNIHLDGYPVREYDAGGFPEWRILIIDRHRRRSRPSAARKIADMDIADALTVRVGSVVAPPEAIEVVPEAEVGRDD